MERKFPPNVLDWSPEDVAAFFPDSKVKDLFIIVGCSTQLSGRDLLLLREKDIVDGFARTRMNMDSMTYSPYIHLLEIIHKVRKLQIDNMDVIESLGYDPASIISMPPPPSLRKPQDTNRSGCSGLSHHMCSFSTTSSNSSHGEHGRTDDGNATSLKPELIKTFIGLLYLFVVTWITAFVMVIVHNRVPDMKKYPPLPDIFLDNVPHIPWAFAMCEFTATLMLLIWVAVLVFHKHRFILLRRFFALSGTVFLLRCVTMLITSLSVPGSHLQCDPMVEELQQSDSVWTKMSHAYTIWSGAGLSIQGVRTCGDYMFSGHTAALTILNFFITEYTPRHLYFMHTFSWCLNMFGIFFILSAHEHYSIDVFIAFYITSRLFLYYHTLANNQALMQRDSTRTRIWFPLFSFFESEIDGIIPNEFDTPASLVVSFLDALKRQGAFFYGISMRRPLRPAKAEKND